MVFRITIVLSVCFLSFVALRTLDAQVVFNTLDTHWREIFFGIVGVMAAWLFVVTQTLRPVVAILAAFAFFTIAMMEGPSGASFLAALDRFSARIMGGVTLG